MSTKIQNVIKRKGLKKIVNEWMLKHFGNITYVIEGIISGLLLHFIFVIVYSLQNKLTIEETWFEIASKIVVFLDYFSIVLCTFIGIAYFCINSYYELRTLKLKMSTKMKKEENKFMALPGKTADIAKQMSDSINDIEVED